MSRTPPHISVLSPRNRAENLFATLLQLESQLDQLNRTQRAFGHKDGDKLDANPDALFTYAERRKDLTEALAAARRNEPDLLPLLPGIARREQRRRVRVEELGELREMAEIRALREQVLPEDERLERERVEEMEQLLDAQDEADEEGDPQAESELERKASDE